MEVFKICRLRIQHGVDRSNMVAILTAAGYIAEEENKKIDYYDIDYFVNVYARLEDKDG